MQKNKGATLIEFMIIVMTLGLIAFAVLAFVGLRQPTAGQHTGIVTSVERNGFIWQTWTAYVKTSAQSTQEDRYCVTDSAVVAALQDDAQAVKEVTVRYGNGAIVWIWQCDAADESIISSVQ